MDFDSAIFSAIAQVTTWWNQMYRHTPLRLLILFLIVSLIHAVIVLVANIITPKLMNWSRSQ